MDGRVGIGVCRVVRNKGLVTAPFALWGGRMASVQFLVCLGLRKKCGKGGNYSPQTFPVLSILSLGKHTVILF